jgi:hypothetical protein
MLPITTLEDDTDERPRMIMQVIRIAFMEVVYKDVKWKPFTIFEE